MRTSVVDQDRAAAIIRDAQVSAYRLRAAWPWLAELTTPGSRTPRATRPVSERAIDAENAQVILDRQAAFHAVQHRRTPGGPRPAAAAIAPVSVRRDVVDAVARLADRLWTATYGDRGTWPVLDGRSATVYTVCRRCNGTGQVPKPAWWPDTRAWPPTPAGATEPLPARCPDCHDGTQVATVHVSASDLLFHTALSMVADLLPEILDADRAQDAYRTLHRADQTVRAAAGAGDDRRVVPAACPVCRNRTLHAEVSSPDPRGWVINCGSPECRCQGARCPCRRDARYHGRRHTWPSREWHAPNGLADTLGIELPALVDAAGRPVTEWTDLDDWEHPVDIANGFYRTREDAGNGMTRWTLTHTATGKSASLLVEGCWDLPPAVFRDLDATLLDELLPIVATDEVEIHVRVIVPARMSPDGLPHVLAASAGVTAEDLRMRSLAATGHQGMARAIGRATRHVADQAAAAAGALVGEPR